MGTKKGLIIAAVLALAVCFTAAPVTPVHAGSVTKGFSHQLSVKVVKNSDGTFTTVNNENQMMRQARTKLGCPYVSGAAGPYAFDCSGYVAYTMHKSGVALTRSTAASYYRSANNVGSIGNAHRGDIVLYSSGGGICHCGLYYGGGDVIQACCSRGVAVRGAYDIGQSVVAVIRTYTPAGVLRVAGDAGSQVRIKGEGISVTKTLTEAGVTAKALPRGTYTVTPVGEGSAAVTVKVRYNDSTKVDFTEQAEDLAA